MFKLNSIFILNLLLGISFILQAKRYDFMPEITKNWRLWCNMMAPEKTFEQYARSKLASWFRFDENEASARANEVFEEIVELYLNNKCFELRKLLCAIAVDNKYEDIKDYFVFHNSVAKLYVSYYRGNNPPEIVNKNHSKNIQRRVIYIFNDFKGALSMCDPDVIRLFSEKVFSSIVYSFALDEEFAPVFLGLPIIALKAFGGDERAQSIIDSATFFPFVRDEELEKDDDLCINMAIEFYNKHKEYFNQCIDEYFVDFY